ncbi:MAG: carbon-nitrogen hydrolase family protein [Nitrospinota bacterium]|nr:MAG: carbon-nitrogen hydrolase family protein [Nitrospinota bacterium]
MKKRVVKVAAVQATPVFMDKRGSIEKYCHYIEQAGREGAELVVTPETGIPTYPYWRGNFGYTDPESARAWRDTVIEFYRNAIRIPSADTDQLCKAAKSAKAYCVIGCNEQDDRPGSQTLYNTLLFISNTGEILGRHRKLMPTHQERFFWGRGDARDLVVFDTEIGRIGGLICFENHMTLLKAALAVKGEEIHACAWPGYWSYGGERRNIRDMSGKVGPLHACDQDCAVREYAFETQTFVVSSSLYLPPEQIPDDFPFKAQANSRWAIGGSCIVNPFGAYLVEPVFNQETIIYAELDMDDRIVAKNVFDCMGHYSRWDVVSLNLKETGYSPLGPTTNELPVARKRQISLPQLEQIAEKMNLSLEKLQAIIRELEQAGTTVEY